MAAFVLVAGTDTGVGKTFVGACIAEELVRAGVRTLAVKPVESGCGPAPNAREDGAILAAATGQTVPRLALVRLREPLTPALAAEREGVVVDVDVLATEIRRFAVGAELILVEGAGGVLSPLSWVHDATDLARKLGARVLLVGADRLGTIHHVHASVAILRSAELPLLGIVLSAPEHPDPSTGTNAASLERRLARYGDVATRIVALPRGSRPTEAVRWVEELTTRA